MEAKAYLRNLRISPRKVQIVLDLIRNKPADLAMAILENTPKSGSEPVAKLLKSAMVTKHVKPRKEGEAGGIIKAEGAMYASKVQLVCPKCGKAVRVGHRILADGTKERVCKNANCGETF